MYRFHENLQRQCAGRRGTESVNKVLDFILLVKLIDFITYHDRFNNIFKIYEA